MKGEFKAWYWPDREACLAGEAGLQHHQEVPPEGISYQGKLARATIRETGSSISLSIAPFPNAVVLRKPIIRPKNIRDLLDVTMLGNLHPLSNRDGEIGRQISGSDLGRRIFGVIPVKERSQYLQVEGPDGEIERYGIRASLE